MNELRQKPILLGALLVLATLLLYGKVTHHEFLEFDDRAYVTKNVHVSTGLSLNNVVWAFTSFHEANWHPITWLSHMADCQLFGLNSGPQHLVNVVLHTVSTGRTLHRQQRYGVLLPDQFRRDPHGSRRL